MNFIRKSEKTLVKSLIYGLIIGVYCSVLFIYKDVSTISIFFVDVIKTSIMISSISFAITLLVLLVFELPE